MDAATSTLRTIWGLAKCPELKLTDDELHMLVESHTGKGSLKLLNKREIITVVRMLQGMKDLSTKKKRRDRRGVGNPSTENQRKKVYMLTKDLGWEKEARVNGLCKKMFSVDRVEWLNYQQCSKLIEALKAMAGREKEADVSD